MKDKQARNLARATLVVVGATFAIPELMAKPTLAIQLSYAARTVIVFAWLWWLTGDRPD